MKKYYYLDGPEKKGPFTKEELINLNLDREVLIWTEGFDNWKPIKDVEEILNVIPPPPPDEVLNTDAKIKKSKKSLYSILILLILLSLSVGIGFFITESNKTNYLDELSNRIERIFNGKFSVCDGEDYGVRGKLEKVHMEGIVEKFTCESGGFTFKELKKVDNGFVLEVNTSTDLVYTSTSYFRGSVQEGYNSAFDYIKNENSGCYTNGAYELIGNFEYLNNEYYYLANVRKPSSPYADHWWSSGEGASIYNDYRKVYYKYEGWYYEIEPKLSSIKNDFLKISMIGGGISILLFILLLAVNPFRW